MTDHGDITEVWTLHPMKGEGPIHAVRADSPVSHLSWCGKLPQFRHVVRPGTTNAVDCPACVLAITRNQPKSRGAR